MKILPIVVSVSCVEFEAIRDLTQRLAEQMKKEGGFKKSALNVKFQTEPLPGSITPAAAI